MTTESRKELLAWLNETLNLNYQKVDECGTGAAYCQLFDSIYCDVPMARVKFDASNEYHYVNNFKILQSAFAKHGITKQIPVERLVKCRFQDNLEFLQWMRKYWLEHKDSTVYDPNKRRRGGPVSRTTSSASHTQPRTAPTRSVSSTSHDSVRTSSAGTFNKRVSSVGTVNSAALQAAQAKVRQLETEKEELNVLSENLETERNFYFNKLREIEVLLQNLTDEAATRQQSSGVAVPLAELISTDDIVKQVQEILYSTEEGFQLPVDEDEVMGGGYEQAVIADEETF